MAGGMLPQHAFPDPAHVAVAAVHNVDYLLTWNCKHLANEEFSKRIEVVCDRLGFRMPRICTPEELIGAVMPCGLTRSWAKRFIRHGNGENLLQPDSATT